MSQITGDPVVSIKHVLWQCSIRGDLKSLDELLAPCVGHVFQLQPPQANLEAIVARSHGWANARWEQRPQWSRESRIRYAPIQPFMDGWTDETGDRLEWPVWPYAKPEPQFWGGDYHGSPPKFFGTLRRVVKERPSSEVCEFWEAWRSLEAELWDRDFSTMGVDFREKLRREIDPVRWRALRPKWGDQLEDSLADSLATAATGYRDVLQGNLCGTLRYAIAFTALAQEPEASWLKASLHELWLQGNFPLHTTENGSVVMLCRTSQEDQP